MAKIIDPDQLNQSTEVVFNTSLQTIQLLVAGNLDDNSPGSTSGVTLQAVYSFCKEEWKSDTALNKFKFPIKMFTKTDGQLQNGWDWADAQTRQLLRDAGWTETNGDQYAGNISLGNFDATGDQAYYQQVTGFDQTTTNYDKTGNLNESILIYDASGPTDYTDYLKSFLRIQGKTYAEYNLLTEQNLSLLEAVLYRLPLENESDIKIDESDANIDANAPYTGMKVNYLLGSGFTTWADSTVYAAGAVVLDPIRQSGGSSNGTWWFTPAGGTSSGTGTADDTGVTDWESYDGEEQIGDEWFAFNRVITGNGGTAQEVYNWAQRQLRKTTDINANDTTSTNQRGFGTVNGNVAALLNDFVGDQLVTQPGVLIRGFDANSTNSITLKDITVDGGGLDSESVPVTTTERNFPFVSAGNINFSDNLVSETNADTIYTMYFTYHTSTAGTDLAISGASGATASLDSSTSDLSVLNTGDWLRISGFTNSENNGLWEVTGATSSTAAALTKRDGNNPTNETAGASVTVLENPIDSAGATIVDNAAGTDITGQVSIGTVAFDYDYTNNVQRGASTGGTDVQITIFAQGLNDSEWTETSGTITQATGLTFNVNANDERNYSNPV